MVKKATALERVLCRMETRINEGFDFLVKPHREAIEAAHEQASKSQYGYGGHRSGCGPSSAITMFCHLIQDIEKERDSAIEFVHGIRAFQELIEAGLLPVAEAIRNVSAERGDRCRLAVGRLIAAPGHERLRRERTTEINDDNDAAIATEKMFSLVQGSLGRVRGARSDQVGYNPRTYSSPPEDK